MPVDTFNRKSKSIQPQPRPRTSSTDDQAPIVRAVIADRAAAWDALLRLRVAKDRQARAAARSALRAAAHALAPSIRDDPGGVRGFIVSTLLARRRPAGLHPHRLWARAVLTSAICAADRRDDDVGLRAAVASLSAASLHFGGGLMRTGALVRDVLVHECSMRRGLDRLLAANLSLVRADVSRFLGPRRDVMGLERSDLEQEGALGLLHALRSFDPDRGNAVSTFAVPWIKQAVRRAVADKAAVVRAPVGLVETVGCIATARRENPGKILTVEDLSRITGRPLARIRSALEAYPVTMSADTPLGGDGAGEPGGATFLDRLEDPTPWDLAEAIATREMASLALAEVSRLAPRDRHVVSTRYLSEAGDDVPHTRDGLPTLESIGRGMNVSRERVRQIEVAALHVIRRRLGADGDGLRSGSVRRRHATQSEMFAGGVM